MGERGSGGFIDRVKEDWRRFGRPAQLCTKHIPDDPRKNTRNDDLLISIMPLQTRQGIQKQKNMPIAVFSNIFYIANYTYATRFALAVLSHFPPDTLGLRSARR